MAEELRPSLERNPSGPTSRARTVRSRYAGSPPRTPLDTAKEAQSFPTGATSFRPGVLPVARQLTAPLPKQATLPQPPRAIASKPFYANPQRQFGSNKENRFEEVNEEELEDLRKEGP